MNHLIARIITSMLASLLLVGCIGDPNEVPYCEGATCHGVDTDSGVDDIGENQHVDDTGEPANHCVVPSSHYEFLDQAIIDDECLVIEIAVGDPVTFDPEYAETDAPSITRNLTIVAAGDSAVIHPPEVGLIAILEGGALTLQDLIIEGSSDLGHLVAPLVKVHPAAKLVLDKTTIRNFNSETPLLDILGAEATVELKSATLTRNTSHGSGPSAIACQEATLTMDSGSSLHRNHTIFEAKLTQNLNVSGAVYAHDCTVMINDTRFSSNTSSITIDDIGGNSNAQYDLTLRGGALTADGGTIEISLSDFQQNHLSLDISTPTSHSGKGIWLDITGGALSLHNADLVLENSTVNDNEITATLGQTAGDFSNRAGRQSHLRGGGLAISGKSELVARIDASTISRNKAQLEANPAGIDLAATGGGISFLAFDDPDDGSPQLQLVNSTIAHNELKNPPGAYGAGLYLAGDLPAERYIALLRYSTIAHNRILPSEVEEFEYQGSGLFISPVSRKISGELIDENPETPEGKIGAPFISMIGLLSQYNEPRLNGVNSDCGGRARTRLVTADDHITTRGSYYNFVTHRDDDPPCKQWLLESSDAEPDERQIIHAHSFSFTELGDNGGPTFTLRPIINSAGGIPEWWKAIAGNFDQFQPECTGIDAVLDKDQRGLDRPGGGAEEINCFPGAVEVQQTEVD